MFYTSIRQRVPGREFWACQFRVVTRGIGAMYVISRYRMFSASLSFCYDDEGR